LGDEVKLDGYIERDKRGRPVALYLGPRQPQTIEFTVPIRIVSEANLREHWAKRAKRKTAQQVEMIVELRNVLRQSPRVAFPCVVTLTRIGPRRLDSDNLANGFKAVRDAIAGVLGIDDGDSRIRFEYEQEANGKREYGVRVGITFY
jgi:hypothetical protein